MKRCQGNVMATAGWMKTKGKGRNRNEPTSSQMDTIGKIVDISGGALDLVQEICGR